MERITKNDLEIQLNYLSEVSGIATSKQDAIKLGQNRYLYIDNNSYYGGCRLVEVDTTTGAHYGSFGGSSCDTRQKPKVFIEMLRSLIKGLRWAYDIEQQQRIKNYREINPL